MTDAITEITAEPSQPLNNSELMTSNDLVELPNKRLPFLYARRAGMLLSKNNDDRVVFYRGELNIDALLEVRRIAGHRINAIVLKPSK